MKRVCGVLLLCICLLWLGGCAPQMAKTQIFAMDTIMELTAYGENAQHAINGAVAELRRLDALFSVTSQSGDVYKINHRTQDTVEISAETAQLLRQAIACGQQTGGAFDVSVYPLMQLWGFNTKQYHVPSTDEIAAVLPLIDCTQIKITQTGETYRVQLLADMQIDLGGIAKGYAAHQAIGVLRAAGVTHAIVSLGGNVQALGPRTDATPWSVGVTDPNNPAQLMGIVQIEDEAVVTAGDYQRFFELDGETYHHIMDPKLGMPANLGLASVTVVGSNGAQADALATAFYVMGKERALQQYKAQGGYDVVFIEKNGQVTATAGLKERLTLQPGSYSLSVWEE